MMCMNWNLLLLMSWSFLYHCICGVGIPAPLHVNTAGFPSDTFTLLRAEVITGAAAEKRKQCVLNKDNRRFGCTTLHARPHQVSPPVHSWTKLRIQFTHWRIHVGGGAGARDAHPQSNFFHVHTVLGKNKRLLSQSKPLHTDAV